MAVMICASVHLPMPVSLSGVMLAAMAVKGFSSKTNPPARFMSLIGRPRFFGVWQFPQATGPS